MSARYLIRFDDICPTQDWKTWNEIEATLVELDVKPILAVVPDNRDPKLVVDPPAEDFWGKVRGWQARGWTIGLHGYQHTYVNSAPGILGMNAQSEFAGLCFDTQVEKLRLGLAIFEQNGVRADAWVAPAHSFDWTTVAALREVGVTVVSDGYALRPYLGPHGTVWIPQQFARPRRLPFGVWTFCCHPNRLSRAALDRFKHDLARLRDSMISLPEAASMAVRERSTADRMVGLLRRSCTLARRTLRPTGPIGSRNGR